MWDSNCSRPPRTQLGAWVQRRFTCMRCTSMRYESARARPHASWRTSTRLTLTCDALRPLLPLPLPPEHPPFRPGLACVGRTARVRGERLRARGRGERPKRAESRHVPGRHRGARADRHPPKGALTGVARTVRGARACAHRRACIEVWAPRAICIANMECCYDARTHHHHHRARHHHGLRTRVSMAGCRCGAMRLAMGRAAPTTRWRRRARAAGSDRAPGTPVRASKAMAAARRRGSRGGGCPGAATAIAAA